MLLIGIKYLSLAAVTVGVTFVTTSPATAVPHGHGHASVAHGSWGHGSSRAHGGSWNRGWHGFYGGYRGYYPRYYGYGSYWPYTYSYVYPYNYYYYPYTYDYYPYTYDNIYPSATNEEMAPSAAPAQVTVQVPAIANVWFNNTLSQTGTTTRQFTTPALTADQDYPVAIRAQWTEGGTTIDRSRTVNLHTGDSVTVNFATSVNPPPTPPVPNR
jgi:uncharacterized protein (TIGR03000 family)